jgi:hypothetical protein
VHTFAEAYCNLIMACSSVGDWERATEWCELVNAFARRHATAPLFGACRTVHAPNGADIFPEELRRTSRRGRSAAGEDTR